MRANILFIILFTHFSVFAQTENHSSEYANILVDSIFLDSIQKQLPELTVTSRIPPFSRKGNSLIANVESTSLSSIGTARDILQQFPAVTLKDNAITVFGKGTPVIYINNRKIYDLNELQSLKSTDVATVELNLTPGAEYDAEGYAVLIIKTRRMKGEGWAAQLSETLTGGHYLNDRENIGINYAGRMFNIFASYEHIYARQDRNPYASYTIHSDTLWQLLADMPQVYTDSYNHFTVGAEWSVTPGHTIGGQYQAALTENKVKSNGINAVSANGIPHEQLSTDMKSENKPAFHVSNAFYDGKWSESFSLHLDLDYVVKKSHLNQTVTEIAQSDEREVNMTGLSDFELYAAKLTATYNMKQAGNIVFGGESNLITGSGSLINPEHYIENSIYSNQENKTAGFISYSNTFNKFQLQTGARYEYTHEQFSEGANNQPVINQQYHRFYPNISLSYLSETAQAGISLSQKIKRPDFAQLNGNNFYANRWLIQRGNPFLKSETIFQLDSYFKYQFLDVNCSYVYKKNPISFGFENIGHQTIMNYVNFPKYQELNLLIAGILQRKYFQTQANIGLRKPFFEIYSLGQTHAKNRLSFSAGCNNTVIFPRQYILSIDFNWQGKSNLYAIEYDQYAYLNLGIRKSFLDDNLSVQLQLTDCFQWIKDHTVIAVNNIVYEQKSIFETRYAALTVSYRFNNYSKNYKGQSASEKDLNRL
ncbi:MAG: outer membrane beta-barrel family protein [Dysgonamonadaceae bacterium]|jgi:hypothetical protein|nr:outer membrane beta-barrel family protein [Dysgonamonadaceae bacterium]